MTGTD